MKLHYSQTGFKSKLDELKVSVPYEITLLSNSIFGELFDVLFQYLMKLHYSQTASVVLRTLDKFQYLMKLHYSQTTALAEEHLTLFQYLMKLHYSQTNNKLRSVIV